MLFSLNYLKKLAYLPNSLSDEVIIESFNALGFEVEEVLKMPQISGIKFGKVLKTYQNPDGDNLTVCEIAFADQTRIIQTTATNLKHGNVIIAFVPGAKRNNIEYHAKKLKNIVSEGMLTSIDELGLNSLLLFNEAPGINHYDDVKDLTIDPITYLNLNDIIVDITILPNRVEANSYYVMALELAAFFHTKVDHWLVKPATLTSDLKIKHHHENFLTMLEATNDYQISWEEKILLTKNNIKITNNINDLANLTFLITGQPVNVYDQKKVDRQFQLMKISHDQSITINQREINVNGQLVICDNKNIIQLVGVDPMLEYQATSETKKVIFSYGQFNHPDVRSNIKLLKYETSSMIQASKLFNKALINLASMFLMSKLDNFSLPINPPLLNVQLPIKYTNEQINTLAGFDLTNNQLFTKSLKSLAVLGFIIEKDQITPPHYRDNVMSFDDLCQEIFRFYNYNHFLLTTPLLLPTKVKDKKLLSERIVGHGFNEIKTYLLTSNAKNQFNPLHFANTINLLTPISNLRSQIRNSIMTSFQETVIYHLKQKIARFDFYEIGQANDGINVLGLVSSYRSFNEIKQILLNVFDHSLTFKLAKNDYLHPNFSAHIYYQSTLIGYIGKINPHLFDHDVICVELKLNDLQAQTFDIRPYVEMPLKSRDITISLKPKTSINQTIKKIKNTDGLFDLFIIDKFIDDSLTKVTLRIIGDDRAIEYIDKHFN